MIQRVLVVGAGQMGCGIAQVIAQAGLEAALLDVKPAFVEKGILSIKKSLNRSVEKNRLTEQEAASILSRITGVSNPDECSKTIDLVIEAVMLAAGAFMMLFCKPDVKKIVKSPVMEACVVSITCVFGVAWMSDSFIAANKFCERHKPNWQVDAPAQVEEL